MTSLAVGLAGLVSCAAVLAWRAPTGSAKSADRPNSTETRETLIFHQIGDGNCLNENLAKPNIAGLIKQFDRNLAGTSG